eukprot:COSAG06_NODE_37890_length_429_cov_460.233333_1_plen_95_part_10
MCAPLPHVASVTSHAISTLSESITRDPRSAGSQAGRHPDSQTCGRTTGRAPLTFRDHLFPPIHDDEDDEDDEDDDGDDDGDEDEDDVDWDVKEGG